MGYKRLFIWVEGSDDETFFKEIIIPHLKERYDCIKTIKYATMSPEKISSFIKSIKAMDADYIFIADINTHPCVTAKKQKLKMKISNLDENKIIIVVREIESWYLSGITDKLARKLKLKSSYLKDTDKTNKEQFNKLIPRKFKKTSSGRIEFMLKILRNFSFETAIRRNQSFKYFVEKYHISNL